MQWIIDMVIDMVGDFIGIKFRGDVAAYDVPPGGWVLNGVWSVFDLSGIVPDGAKFVVCNLVWSDNVVGTRFSFRRFGNVNVHSRCQGFTQVANQPQGYNFTCPISDDRKIEYKFDATPTITNFIVIGWLLAT